MKVVCESLMQLGDLGAHLHTELRVQVGERFVHQEDLRITDDRAAQGDALTLAAGKRLGLAVEELLDVQDLRGLCARSLSISSFGVLRSFRPKAMLSYTVMCG